MMRKNKAVKILRNTKKTALLIYAAAFILLIVAGVRVSGITKEAVRGNDRHKPYEFYELYNDFSIMTMHGFRKKCIPILH